MTASGGAASLKEQADAAAQTERANVATDPLVAQVLSLFPGSTLTVKAIEPEAPPLPEPEPLPPEAEEIGYMDEIITDDDL